MGHLDWLKPNQASPSLSGIGSEMSRWQFRCNKRRVAELNHQSAKSHDLTPTVQPAAPLEILTNQVRLDTEFSLMNILSYQGSLKQVCLQSMSCPIAVHCLLTSIYPYVNKKARPGVPNRAWSKTREAFDRVLDGDGKLPPPQASSTDATQLGDAIKDCSMNALKYYARWTLLSSAPLSP